MSAGNANYYPGTVTQVITISSSMLMAEIPAKTPIENGYNTTNERDGVVDLGVVASKALSPNGDGYNDTFIIQNIEKYPSNEVVIANRSGEAVFKAEGYNNDTILFAGRSRTGVELPDGMYYYTVIFYNQGKMNKCVGYFKLRR